MASEWATKTAEEIGRKADELWAAAGEASQVAQDGRAGDELWEREVAAIIQKHADAEMKRIQTVSEQYRSVAEVALNEVERTRDAAAPFIANIERIRNECEDMGVFNDLRKACDTFLETFKGLSP